MLYRTYNESDEEYGKKVSNYMKKIGISPFDDLNKYPIQIQRAYKEGHLHRLPNGGFQVNESLQAVVRFWTDEGITYLDKRLIERLIFKTDESPYTIKTIQQVLKKQGATI